MTPAAFVDAAAAWGLAPGFRRAGKGRAVAANVGPREPAGDADRRDAAPALRTDRDQTARAAVTVESEAA